MIDRSPVFVCHRFSKFPGLDHFRLATEAHYPADDVLEGAQFHPEFDPASFFVQPVDLLGGMPPALRHETSRETAEANPDMVGGRRSLIFPIRWGPDSEAPREVILQAKITRSQESRLGDCGALHPLDRKGAPSAPFHVMPDDIPATVDLGQVVGSQVPAFALVGIELPVVELQFLLLHDGPGYLVEQHDVPLAQTTGSHREGLIDVCPGDSDPILHPLLDPLEAGPKRGHQRAVVQVAECVSRHDQSHKVFRGRLKKGEIAHRLGVEVAMLDLVVFDRQFERFPHEFDVPLDRLP